MSFAWPLALLSLLAVPLAVVGYVALERRRRRQAALFASPGARAEPHRPEARAAAAPASRARPDRARAARDRARPPAREPVGQARGGNGRARRSTPPARWSRPDVEPSRLAAVQKAVRHLPRQAAEGLPRRDGLVRRLGLRRPPADREPRGREARAEGPAPGRRHRRRRGNRARGAGRGEGARRRTARRRRRRSSSSPTARRRRARSSRSQAARRAKKEKIPVYTVSLGTPNGVVEVRGDDGFIQRVTVPPDPADDAQDRGHDRRALLRCARRRAPATRSTRSSARGSAQVKKKREVTAAFAAGGALLLLASGARLARCCSGGSREAAAPARCSWPLRRSSAGAAAPAGAGTECEMLPVCIRGRRAVGAGARRRDPDLLPPLLPRPRARRSAGSTPTASGRVEVKFLGALGGPISPGVTTGRDGGLRRPPGARTGGVPAAARLHPGQRRRRPLAHGLRAAAHA